MSKSFLARVGLKKKYFETIHEGGIDDNILIRLTDIKKNYRSKKVLRGVNLTIKKGEHIAILGANGAGKSTLTEIIATIKEPSEGTIYYSFGNKKKKITPNIGMQFQDSSYPPTYKVIDLVHFFAKSGKNRLNKEEIEEFMRLFNLWDFKQFYADSLSGGQRQRLNILLSVINSPKLLILDELSTGLDIDSVEKIQNYILDYVNKNEITLLLVSHNPDEVKTLTDRVVLIDNGVVYKDELISEIEKEYSSLEDYLFGYFEEKAAKRNHLDFSEEDFEFKKFTPKKEAKTNYDFLQEEQDRIIFAAKEKIRFVKYKRSLDLERAYQDEIEEKAKLNEKWLAKDVSQERKEKSSELDYADDVHDDKVSLKLTNIVKRYGKKEVLKGIDLTFNKKEKVAIIGANGAGKSTLTEIISTIKEPTEGKIYYSFGKSKYDITANIGMQFQDTSYPIMFTVKNLVYFFARANYRSMSTYEIHKALKVFNLYKLRNNIAESLSGGQKQRLNVLLTLIKKPKLLILDEVSTGLDIEAVEEIKKFILNYVEENDVNLILVSHNIKEIADMADRIIALKDGVVFKDVTLEQIQQEYNEERPYYAIKKLSKELFASSSNSDLIEENFIPQSEDTSDQLLNQLDDQEEATLELKDLSQFNKKDYQELIKAQDSINDDFTTIETESVVDQIIKEDKLQSEAFVTLETEISTIESEIKETIETIEEELENIENSLEKIEFVEDDSKKLDIFIEEEKLPKEESLTSIERKIPIKKEEISNLKSNKLKSNKKDVGDRPQNEFNFTKRPDKEKLKEALEEIKADDGIEAKPTTKKTTTKPATKAKTPAKKPAPKTTSKPKPATKAAPKKSTPKKATPKKTTTKPPAKPKTTTKKPAAKPTTKATSKPATKKAQPPKTAGKKAAKTVKQEKIAANKSKKDVNYKEYHHADTKKWKKG